MTGSSVCSLQMIRVMNLKRIHFFINPILFEGNGVQAAFARNGLSNVVGKGKGGGICRFIFPILPRRNPVLFFKRFAEVGFGLETDVQRDRQDGIGSLPQQNGGLA